MNVLSVLCGVALACSVLVFSAIALVFNEKLYEEIQPADAVPVTRQFLQYLSSSSFDVPRIEPLTERENSHLRDVKIVVYRLELVLIASVIGLFLLRKYLTKRVVFVSVLLLVVAPVVLVIVPFDPVFRLFHIVFFPQGNWQFDPATTTLVNVYPEEFFQQFFLQIVLTSWMIGAGVLFASHSRPPP